MPRIKTNRTKTPPSDFKLVSPTLDEFALRLKEATLSSKALPSSSKNASLWEIHQIYHQRSRYIYDMYYSKEAISSELYQWILKNNYADANLIAKWKKQGYEKLCCLRCIQTGDNIHGGTCICRVPRSELKEGHKVSGCVTCGCRGCASTD
ncbi:Bud site selection protein 31, partial [Nadsonia fulvescens var. elongata DSM 6958]